MINSHTITIVGFLMNRGFFVLEPMYKQNDAESTVEGRSDKHAH